MYERTQSGLDRMLVAAYIPSESSEIRQLDEFSTAVAAGRSCPQGDTRRWRNRSIASLLMVEARMPFEEPVGLRVLPELIGESVPITNLRAEIAHLLTRQGHGRRLPTLLLLGETGTGKGLLARAIHRASHRAARPFVDIDCAAIPETLLEAELFGVERGAFTDARETKPGLFQTARGGTLLLDEVGLLPKMLQGKLLKVVEERAVRRLGSTQTEVVDLWVLAATNVDLSAAARNGEFREDLYHRLAAVTLMLPPLREREGDIVLLAEHFLARTCTEYHLPPKRLAADALAAMTAYHWPGNVRQLANMTERAALMSADDAVISEKSLGLPVSPAPRAGRPVAPETPHLKSQMAGFEREQLVEALRSAGGNITRAAERLGLPRNTLRYRMDKLGIDAESVEESPVRMRRAPAAMPTGSSGPGHELRSTFLSRREEVRTIAFLVVDGPERDDLPWAPEEVREFVAAKVRGLGGRMEATAGTALAATFGAYPCADPASRAAQAAIAIWTTMGGLSVLPSRPPTARIGIHACEMLVRRINSSFVVDEAYRRQADAALETMLSSTNSAAMLCSQAAARLLTGRFELERMATGAADAEPIFRLLGHRGPRRPLMHYPSTPFVGRRLRLELLEGLFGRAVAGHGQAVGIVGEAGAGKSRLLDEFCQRLEQKQLAHHWARFVPYGPGLADLTVAEVLRQAWHIAHEDGVEAITKKVRSSLENLGMDADRWAPYVLLLFGGQADAGQLARLNREELKLRVFDALRRVAIGWSRREPLILEVDDLQLFGKTATAFLSYLVEDLASTRILLLATYRPEYQPAWAGKSYFTQLTLPPLPPDESLTLLGTLLPKSADTPRLAKTIVDRAEGNPLFLEELARSAVQAKEPGADPCIPDTVRAVLEGRMDRLESGARRLLRVASVLGRRVPAKLLELVCDEPQRLREFVAQCKRLELLQEEFVDSEPVYAFKNALIWELARQSISPSEQHALRSIARVSD